MPQCMLLPQLFTPVPEPRRSFRGAAAWAEMVLYCGAGTVHKPILIAGPNVCLRKACFMGWKMARSLFGSQGALVLRSWLHEQAELPVPGHRFVEVISNCR